MAVFHSAQAGPVAQMCCDDAAISHRAKMLQKDAANISVRRTLKGVSLHAGLCDVVRLRINFRNPRLCAVKLDITTGDLPQLGLHAGNR